VRAKIEDQLSLDEMAESAGLSTAHFSQMFRKSTGESPHQFVLRHRVQRAKKMLRAAEVRMLDVAVACGFKTQQHFARVFRQLCGAIFFRMRHTSNALQKDKGHGSTEWGSDLQRDRCSVLVLHLVIH
jgi:transcriptional regulator GlxA family with amidase domain